ncbi:MAG TPA: DUF2125 domain-containing protein [Stellaceae bacterium]
MSAARRTVLSLVAVVVVAAITYSAYWRYAAGKLREQLAPWAEARAAEGYLVRWDKARISGFPGAFRIDFANLNVGTLRPLPVAISAGAASAWAMPWNFRHWEFTAPQGARLLDPTGTSGFAAHHLDGVLDVEGRTATQLDITALDVAGIGLAQGIAVGDAEAHIELPATPPQSHSDMALGLSLQVDHATLPTVPGFGDSLSGFTLAAQFKGALPPGPFVQALSRWRDNGGTVDLQSLRLRWGALLLDASGTLALDGALQPEGAFSAIITGQDAAVDVAVMTGTLKPDAAGAVKTLLGLLSQPNAEGQNAVTLPMTIENQRLYLGPAKIADIPPIRWH